ncbi:MAG: CoA-binding protein [Spirochaetes bacterium]|nr:CoA-binding protein [Spirochaetota bacterium]
MEPSDRHVAILGASANPDRYAYMAQKLLMDKGYNVYPINPNYEHIENKICFKKVTDVENEIDTLTVYLSPEKLELTLSDIILKKPTRIILNPGSESKKIKNKIIRNGIQVLEACTLVLLKTGQF